MSVIFETSLGDLTIDLFLNDAPKTCENFLKLCKLKYYDHCLFFNIQKDFTVQCGDPTNTGEGGSSVWGLLHGDKERYIKDEITPRLKHDKKGIVAMASLEQDKNGSQFYITTSTRLSRLDGQHTIFGEVVEGLETLEKINEAVVTLSGRPVQVLRIQHTIVLEDPFPDPKGLLPPSRSPSPPRRWAADLLPEDLEDFEESEEARRAHLAAEAAKAKAEALVLIGELPDAEVRPPDNVLFVCKLNPATTGASLSVIFSRFGHVAAADIVYDRRGESLCYGFVEFDQRTACEEAYLKMQNVLIDGRRIHVDFCQSVSKVEGFRAAGGWKNFFADRAKGMNAASDDRSTGLSFKQARYTPISFTAHDRPRHDRHHDHPSHHEPSHHLSRDHPPKRDYDDRRHDDNRREYSQRPHHDSHRDHHSKPPLSYDRDASYSRDTRYDDRRDSHHPREHDQSRKRSASPSRDEYPSKRSKYSD